MHFVAERERHRIDNAWSYGEILAMDLFSTILAALGGGVAAAIALSKLLGQMWADRILAKTKAQHDADLHALKSDLELQLEQAKWPMAREDALAAGFRDSLQALLLPILSAAHSICWITWFASEFPDELDQKKLDQYEDEMHVLLPKVSSALTLLSAHDAEAYELLKEHARKLYSLDAKIATTARQLFAAREAGSSDSDFLSTLSNYHRESGDLEWGIPDEVAGLVRKIVERRTSAIVSAN